MKVFYLLLTALTILLIAKADEDDYFEVGDWVDWI